MVADQLRVSASPCTILHNPPVKMQARRGCGSVIGIVVQRIFNDGVVHTADLNRFTPTTNVQTGFE